MTIQLVSINLNINDWDEQFHEVLEVINASCADIILFPGDTVRDKKQFNALERRVTNRKSVIFLEINSCGGHLSKIPSSKQWPTKTPQYFSRSKEINNNPEKARSFLQILRRERTAKVKGKRILLLQCGENNIIRNFQSEGNRTAFRFYDEPSLNKEWEDLFVNVDIVLNPIHTMMKIQGKMARRREYLSSDGRAYFSVNNTDNFNQKSCHYGYVNGKPIEGEKSISETGRSCSWIYEI